MSSYQVEDVDEYLLLVDLYASALPECPRCNSKVHVVTSRDINVMDASVECLNQNCGLVTFTTEYISGEGDEDTLLDDLGSRYTEWCLSKPTNYRDTFWG